MFKSLERANFYDAVTQHSHQLSIANSRKLLAAERLPELVDELGRRAFTKVELFEHHGVEAQIVGGRGVIYLGVGLSVDLDRPYIVRFSINDVDEYKVLVPGRELSFDAVIQCVDYFLAGVAASKRI